MIDYIDSLLQEKGICISQNIVSNALEELGYSKQKNKKMEQVGVPHPDREAQFAHKDETGSRYIEEGEPFISVDCKKKENIGKVEVSHFPSGTSKWNKIEHRLFAYVRKNWEGKPLIDIVTVVKLIGSTATKGELKVVCDVDERNYPTGIKVDDEILGSIDIEFHGPNEGWNYTIKGFKN